MRRKSASIALGGVLSALAVTVMLMGSIIPLATFVAPALSALCVLFFALEWGNRAAVGVYIVISALSLLLAADKELALIFVFVVGYYPILKSLAERLRSKAAGYLVKFGVFNLAVVSLYYIMLNIFVVASVREEFSEYSVYIIVALLLLGNVTLFFYDRVLTKLSITYLARWRPKFMGGDSR